MTACTASQNLIKMHNREHGYYCRSSFSSSAVHSKSTGSGRLLFA